LIKHFIWQKKKVEIVLLVYKKKIMLMVLDTGLEPVTSSMSWKHSTTELIEHIF
jgi:hypothetical protein